MREGASVTSKGPLQRRRLLWTDCRNDGRHPPNQESRDSTSSVTERQAHPFARDAGALREGPWRELPNLSAPTEVSRSSFRTGLTTRRGTSRSRVCRRVSSTSVTRGASTFAVRPTPFPSAPFVCRRDAVARLSVSAGSWHHFPCSSTTTSSIGVTWHTCLCHVGGDAIKCGERFRDSLVLALHRDEGESPRH